MVVPFDKVLINLSYKAPELKLQYALAELLDYVQEVKLLEAKTLLLQQGNTLHRELEKQYEARIAELDAQSEGMPWEDVQKFQDALRAEYGKVIAEKDARIAELEGELALLKAGSVIQLFHPDGCLCDICDNRLEEDK